MKKRVFLFIIPLFFALLGAIAWFWPAHQASVFLGEISKLKPGITNAAQIEALSSRGLVKRVASGCEHGFENQHDSGPQAAAISRTGDLCYSFMFRNTLASFLHLAPTTGIYGTLTIRNGELTLIKLTYQMDWLFFNVSDQACDSCNPNHSNYFVDKHLSGASGVPGNVHVYLTSKSTQQQRREAYALNTTMLAYIGKGRDARDFNSAIWSAQ